MEMSLSMTCKRRLNHIICTAPKMSARYNSGIPNRRLEGQLGGTTFRPELKNVVFALNAANDIKPEAYMPALRYIEKTLRNTRDLKIDQVSYYYWSNTSNECKVAASKAKGRVPLYEMREGWQVFPSESEFVSMLQPFTRGDFRRSPLGMLFVVLGRDLIMPSDGVGEDEIAWYKANRNKIFFLTLNDEGNNREALSKIDTSVYKRIVEL